MKLRLFIILLCLWPASVWAQQSDGFSTIAPQTIIMDYESGLVLYEKSARAPAAPASMTKIMTAEIVFEKIQNGSLSLDTEFMVSDDAVFRGGEKSGSSTMFLRPGSRVRVEDLLKGVIIQSGNDACIVLAENIAGSESAFAELMTTRARAYGLSSATFKNSTGWPHSEHNISLYDLARLAERTIRNYPKFYPLYSEMSFSWEGVTQKNRNPLLGRFPGADGLKTGHTRSSGYGLVASAERGGKRRIMVVNGLKSKAQRQSESLRLMQAAFDVFDTKTLYKKEQRVEKVAVYMGKDDVVDVVASEDIIIPIERTSADSSGIASVSIFMKTTETVPAPIQKGDKIAELIIRKVGEEDQVFPLVAANDVSQKSAIGRVWAGLSNMLGM